MLCSVCNQTITIEKKCGCLNSKQWDIVRKIKNDYKLNIQFPTKRGLAIHIWKELLLIKQNNEELEIENNHLWSVRSKDIATAVIKSSAKMNEEIISLKNEILRLENINKNLRNQLTKQTHDTYSKIEKKSEQLICSQCGSCHTCYCK
ncbi:hypothetical protein [Proteus vulgaris]|uniref:hypothetical protein n=1 Tax=Proteus vulgaris TaxID=585 RepID=UPI0021A5C569|nr:hypothetical protein [Proteus vulgaris]